MSLLPIERQIRPKRNHLADYFLDFIHGADGAIQSSTDGLRGDERRPRANPERCEMMTPQEEIFVRETERCPKCIPREGRTEPMRLLGDFGPMRAYQCKRCSSVWCINTPNAQGEAQPPAKKL